MSTTEYRDFWLRIENRPDGLYVRANSAAGGSVAAPLRLPDGVDATTIGGLLRGPGGAARGAADGATRDMAFEDEDPAPPPSDREIGAALFQALFPDPVRDAFMRNVGSGKENGVRIRLQIDLSDPEVARLAGLPWELLYNGTTRQALGRSKFTPIIRSLDVAQPSATPPFRPPLRVLLVLANPAGTHALGLDREKERITEVLGALDDVEVEVLEHATERALYDRLDAGRFHVLHYMGHGGFDAERGGVLLLEDGRGGAAPLPARLLGDDLAERRAMRLVFLNACDTGRTNAAGGVDPFTGVASSLVAAGIPAVVAMQVPIADTAAFEFAATFYSQIAHGEPVDAAVAVGRRAIYRADPGSLEWATPVLFMRSEGGDLFTAPDEARATPPAAGPPADPAPLSRAAPERPPRPAPVRGASGWLKRGGTATLAGLGALVVVLFIADGAGCLDEPDGAYDEFAVDPDSEFGAEPPEPEPPAPGGGAADLTPTARDLILASGLGFGMDDDELADVAETVVEDRAALEQEGRMMVYQGLASIPAGATATIPLTLRPGSDYAVLATCDNDCDALGLRVFDGGGSVLAEVSDKAPDFDVTAAAPGDHVLEVTLERCSTDECFVGVGVYSPPGG